MKSLTITRGVALCVALTLLACSSALAAPAGSTRTAATGSSGATGSTALATVVHHHRRYHPHLAKPAVSDAALAAQTGANAKLSLPGTSRSHTTVSGTGSSIIRTLVALLVVIALIYGISWILKQYKGGRSRATGTGLEQVASLPLGNNRSVSLVRVGNELVLLGVAEHQVTALHHYDADGALAAGIPIDEYLDVVATGSPGGVGPATDARRLALPRRSLRLGAGATARPALPAGIHTPSLRDIGRRMVHQAREMTVRSS